MHLTCFEMNFVCSVRVCEQLIEMPLLLSMHWGFRGNSAYRYFVVVQPKM